MRKHVKHETRTFSRNEFISLTGTAVAAFVCAPISALSATTKNHKKMYGLIGKITAKAGKRDELIKILIEGVSNMPGCLSYIISKDSEDEHALWITEVWDNKESHRASLTLPSVQEAISRGKPLIAGFDEQIETIPVGGHGLTSTES